MSTFTQIATVVAAIAIAATITYHLTRLRAPARHWAAVISALHAAHRDDLTGLGNRAGLHAALTAATRPASVILINLDGEQVFVSRFGNRLLDQLLVLIAGRLQHVAFTAGGRVFRTRRGEFAVILDDLADAADLAAQLVAAVAERTHLHLARFNTTVTVTVTACAGVASFFPHADRRAWLALVHTDRALRAAKRVGRGRTEVFAPATMRGLDTVPGARTDGGQAR
ncbi:GGDEF domain-containing protein [Micromonospora aurantiaca (nom. illeg.)]|uniref:GGDEF domain-containing protein n=1 Tax=Micromonospora aurantiaca (nom. illeg.) TaxID=47850 RepID=UPI0033E4151B